MAETGTGYIIQVSIDSHRNIPMKDMDFYLEFYIHRSRKKTVRKDEMVRIDRADGTAAFYALLDTRTLGQGVLMCDASISDPEPQWGVGGRPVVIRRKTGISVGEGFCNPADAVQRSWDQGYKVDFSIEWGLPKPEVAYIFYGKFVDHIQSFDEITPEMLLSPGNRIISVKAGKMGKTPVSDIIAGNKVLVLIPSSYNYVATKDNGIGGKVPFDTSIMGCNGEKSVKVDGVTYRIYGEFMTVGGELFIYVD